jgi:hypothetical protein
MDVLMALQAAGFDVRLDGSGLHLRYRGTSMPPTLELWCLLDQAQRKKERVLEQLYVQAEEDDDAQGARKA